MLCEIDLVYYSMLQIARPQTLCVICKSAVIRITVEPFSDNSASDNICTLVFSQSRGFFFAYMVASVNKNFVELVFRRGTPHPKCGLAIKSIYIFIIFETRVRSLSDADFRLQCVAT